MEGMHVKEGIVSLICQYYAGGKEGSDEYNVYNKRSEDEIKLWALELVYFARTRAVFMNMVKLPVNAFTADQINAARKTTGLMDFSTIVVPSPRVEVGETPKATPPIVALVPPVVAVANPVPPPTVVALVPPVVAVANPVPPPTVVALVPPTTTTVEKKPQTPFIPPLIQKSAEIDALTALSSLSEEGEEEEEEKQSSRPRLLNYITMHKLHPDLIAYLMKISERINPGKWATDAPKIEIYPSLQYDRVALVVTNICDGVGNTWKRNMVEHKLTKEERVAISNKAVDQSYTDTELRCVHAVLSFYGKQKVQRR
jgi:hypothetical protein